MLKSVPDRAFHGFAEDEAGAGAGAFAWAVDGSSDLTRDCFDLDTRFSKRGVAHEPTCCRRKLRVPPSMPAAWLVGKRRKTKAARRVFPVIELFMAGYSFFGTMVPVVGTWLAGTTTKGSKGIACVASGTRSILLSPWTRR